MHDAALGQTECIRLFCNTLTPALLMGVIKKIPDNYILTAYPIRAFNNGNNSLHFWELTMKFVFLQDICFELGGVTVDPQTLAFDPRPLIPYMASLGVPYFYEEQCKKNQNE